MIKHITFAFKIDSEQDFKYFLCECLNRYVDKFHKLPNYVYTETEMERPRELKGPKLRFRVGAKNNLLMIGHSSDILKLESGDLADNTISWSINA